MGDETDIVILRCPYCFPQWISHNTFISHLISYHDYPIDTSVEDVKKRLNMIGGLEMKVINKKDIEDFI